MFFYNIYVLSNLYVTLSKFDLVTENGSFECKCPNWPPDRSGQVPEHEKTEK